MRLFILLFKFHVSELCRKMVWMKAVNSLIRVFILMRLFVSMCFSLEKAIAEFISLFLMSEVVSSIVPRIAMFSRLFFVPIL